MIIGAVVGALLPPKHWLGVDIRLWAVLLVMLGAVVLFAATKLLKGAFGAPPQSGWSISVALAYASSRDVSAESHRVGVTAAWLLAIANIVGGIMLGQALSIFASFAVLR